MKFVMLAVTIALCVVSWWLGYNEAIHFRDGWGPIEFGRPLYPLSRYMISSGELKGVGYSGDTVTIGALQNNLRDMIVVVNCGAAAGQARRVRTNTGERLFVLPPFDPPPAEGDCYALFEQFDDDEVAWCSLNNGPEFPARGDGKCYAEDEPTAATWANGVRGDRE